MFSESSTFSKTIFDFLIRFTVILLSNQGRTWYYGISNEKIEDSFLKMHCSQNILTLNLFFFAKMFAVSISANSWEISIPGPRSHWSADLASTALFWEIRYLKRGCYWYSLVPNNRAIHSINSWFFSWWHEILGIAQKFLPVHWFVTKNISVPTRLLGNANWK